MSKNKLLWIIALILVIALPVAYAQTAPGTSQIILVLINAVVVGVVLFLLQAIMMPGKEAKEKNAVWIAIFAFSLFIALYFGRTDFIWRSGPLSSFFEIHIFVNALVIGIALYFALGVMGVKEKLGKSPEAQKGYGIMIFIGALVWAIGIASSYGKIYVWNAYSYFISYFIGPEGIFNPYPPAYRLLVFAGSFFLLSFFFNHYLLQESKQPKINYGLALILAMNMASSGVTISSIIILGELVFVLVLQKALLSTAKDNSLLSWIMAIILVGWASAAMTYGTKYQGFLGGIIGFVWKWGGWGSLVAIAVIILFLSWGIGRGEKGQGIWQRFKQRTGTRLANEIKTRAQSHLSQVGVVTKWDIPPDREPKSFVENRLLLFALLDYGLRIDIANSKRYLFDYKKRAKMTELWLSLGRYWNRKRLREEIKNYRSQVGGSTATFAYGWALFDKKLLTSMEELTRLMYRSIYEVNRANPNLNVELTNIAQRMENINNELRTIATGANTAYRNFDGRIEPYGTWHHIRSILINIYDMYNVYGKFEHDYIFPLANAKFRTNPYVAPDPLNAAAIAALPQATPVLDPSQTSSDSDTELNHFGFDVGRINRGQTNLRLLNPRTDSDFHPNLASLAQWYSTEWKGFTEDFRKGTFSPNTRTVQDYSDAFAKGSDVHMDDDSVAFKRQGGIAFDRRALVDPGLWKYWGRRRYYGDVGDVVMESPYPRLTLLGIQTYLELLIRTRERDPERVINEFLDNYPMDLEREVETQEDLVRAIGRWREKKAT